eukprot:11273632-Prorocentrum_lima.AAC.1
MVQLEPAAPPACALSHQLRGQTSAAALTAWPGTSKCRSRHRPGNQQRESTLSCPPGTTGTLAGHRTF